MKPAARRAPKSVIRRGMYKVHIWCLSMSITRANSGEQIR